MPLRKTFFIISLVLFIFCLATGYLLSGQWFGVGMTIIIGLAWWFVRKYPASWLTHLCLLASVCLAVAGCLAGASPVFMILGSGVALAVWDLSLLNVALEDSTVGEQTKRYENQHLRSLALALGFGLLAVLLGHWLKLQIPFVMLILFIALVLFGLDRIWSYLKKADSR
jgi:hypothetical protein